MQSYVSTCVSIFIYALTPEGDSRQINHTPRQHDVVVGEGVIIK